MTTTPTTNHTIAVLEVALDALDLGKHEGCPCSECRPAVNRRLAARGIVTEHIAALDENPRPLLGDRCVLYLCHPVGGDVDGNVERALLWLAWLRRHVPRSVTVVAPWIAGILCGEDDADPEQRERGLVDCEATVARLDGAILTGGRVSSGMARESAAARAVYDLTDLGALPPADWPDGVNPLGPRPVGFERPAGHAFRGGLAWVAPDRTEES